MKLRLIRKGELHACAVRRPGRLAQKVQTGGAAKLQGECSRQGLAAESLSHSRELYRKAADSKAADAGSANAVNNLGGPTRKASAGCSKTMRGRSAGFEKPLSEVEVEGNVARRFW
jgi:hypothetical protein